MYTRFRAPIAAAVTALLVSALSVTAVPPAQAAATIVNGAWSVAPDPGYNIFHFDGSITSQQQWPCECSVSNRGSPRYDSDSNAASQYQRAMHEGAA